MGWEGQWQDREGCPALHQPLQPKLVPGSALGSTFLALQWLLPSFLGCNGAQISNFKVLLAGPSQIQAWSQEV